MGRIADFKKMLKERRVGFVMDETMSGHHTFEPGQGPSGTLPFVFKGTWGPRDLVKWINPFGGQFMVQPMKGWITAGGLCEKAPMSGTLELAYFTEGKIRYTFDFSAKGKMYRYVGEKVNIRPWNLPVSHTTCFGTLVEKESGRLVSRSVTFFKLHTTPAFMASLRFS